MAAQTCIKCGSLRIKRYRNRIQSGSYQVVDWCLDCDCNARGIGICIPHRQVDNLTALPILHDYLPQAEACVVCGSRNGSQRHHFAPKHIFGPETAERYPTAFLCQECHDNWHRVISEHSQLPCEYCRSLRIPI